MHQLSLVEIVQPMIELKIKLYSLENNIFVKTVFKVTHIYKLLLCNCLKKFKKSKYYDTTYY